MSKFAVILAAAGKSSRFADPHTKKVYAQIQSKPLWMYSAEKFASRDDVGQILIVIAPDDKETFNEKHAGNAAMLGVQPVLGGKQRADSVRNALEKVNDNITWVAIHDAARPCIAERWIDGVFNEARKTGAAILATPCSSTLKRVRDGKIEETVPRDGLWLAQTPQVFDVKLLSQAYANHSNPSSVTDDASLMEAAGHPVSIVEGSPLNIKVTTQPDLRFAELALKALPKPKAFPF